MKRGLGMLTTAALVLGLQVACKAPEPPPPVKAPADAPPQGANVMGGKPTADAPVAQKGGIPDFEKAIKVDVGWDPARTAVVAKVHLEPGFHAYGAGEKTGKPLAMELSGTSWKVKELKLPPGEEKDLGEMGKSYVIHGDVELVAALEPAADAKAPVEGVVRYQVCTETSCDRPRTAPFKLTPG
ncbi:MAG: protein-disulfide reductase DsbD domain-containing protein [Myxococcota bacterium]